MIVSWWKLQLEKAKHDDAVSVMPRWSIWAGAVLLLIVGAASMWALFTLFGAGTSQDKTRLEIVKLAGSIVVGTGGAAALLLAARRQRSTEVSSKQAEQDLKLKRQAAADARHDATERRITELYAGAAEQLGSEKAPVRLAALYALERLAQYNSEHRQTVVDLFCAYLRMPFFVPAEEAEREAAEWKEELQVRLTAQRILCLHSRNSGGDKLWSPDVQFDLTGAVLWDMDMEDCVLVDACFIGAIFHGVTHFEHAEFAGVARFEKARFRDDSWFSGVSFWDGAWFDDAKFEEDAHFYKVLFNNGASFGDAEFMGSAGFNGAKFEGVANFEIASFRQKSDFTSAKFRLRADMREAKFHGSVDFSFADFSYDAVYIFAFFGRDVTFHKVNFGGVAHFDRAKFSSSVRFESDAQSVSFDRSHAYVEVEDSNSVMEGRAWPNGWGIDEAAPSDGSAWRKIVPVDGGVRRGS